MTTEYTKPLPRPLNPEFTKPFWDAAKRHELVMPRCTKCDHFHFYPRTECPRCFSTDIEWTPVSGKGRLYSFTVIRQPVNPAFMDDVPYVYALVQLAEGPRIVANLVGCPIEDVSVDMPLTVDYNDVTPEWTLVNFRPA